MAWYLRKSLRLGPLRFNFSKRGVGVSAGVKGARVGAEASGKTYVAGGRYGFYFRQRLDAPHPPHTQAASSAPPESTPEAASGRGGRSWWWIAVLALGVGLLLGAWLAHGEERTRVDMFDTHGNRSGYAIVDRQTGRVDYYDAKSHHTGWGQVDATGRAERFDMNGQRQEGTVLPLPPPRPPKQ